MKTLSESLRVLLLLLALGAVFILGEAPSEAAAVTTALPPVATTASLTPASAPVGQGAALLLAAYGFQLQLRRRGLRLR